MNAPPRKNRLSPPLMFVFRAANAARDAREAKAGPGSGARVVAAGDVRTRAPQRVAVTEQTLRREVARDLEVLLNCVSMESSTDLTDFPAVRKSVLNYGFPDIAHRTIDELSAADLDQEIAEILRTFEPRLIASTIRVTRDKSVGDEELRIRYTVHSDLSCEPLNVPLQFFADVDVTTGNIQIHRL